MYGMMNKITLHKEYQHCMTNIVFFALKRYNPTTTKQQSMQTYKSQKLNPGLLLPQSDASPLGHRDNSTFVAKQLPVSTLGIET